MAGLYESFGFEPFSENNLATAYDENGNPVKFYHDYTGINDYFKLKNERLTDYKLSQLNRTLTMFKYRPKHGNAIKGFKERDLELIRQNNGYGAYFYRDGQIYFLKGNFAPPINYLEQNTGFLVANAYDTSLSGKYKLVNVTESVMVNDGEFINDAVLFRNDPLCRGLMPIFNKYGIMTIENDITFRLANINLRQFIQMIVKDENGEESAELYFEHIENGDQYVLVDEQFEYDGMKGNPLTIPAGFMTQLIETAQYIKASQANEIGLNANYNMKRERLSESESDLNEDILRPLPDIMLEERNNDLKDLEDYTGGEVAYECDFDSVWLKNSVAFDNTMYTLTGDDEDTETDETVNEQLTEDAEDESVEENDDVEEVEEDDTDGQDTDDGAIEGESGDSTTPDSDSDVDDSSDISDEVKEDVVETVADIVEDIKEIVENVANVKDDEEDKEDVETDSDADERFT